MVLGMPYRYAEEGFEKFTKSNLKYSEKQPIRKPC